MKRGFSLIEVMIAFLVASLLTVSLYQLLKQSTKAVLRINQVVDTDIPLAAFYAQFRRDISGAFIPMSSRAVYEKKATKAAQSNEQTALEQTRSERQAPQDSSEKTKAIQDVFVVKEENNRLLISFITTGGLTLLDTEGHIVPQSYVRRVLYSFEKDSAGLMRLMYRYSVDTLGFDAITGAKAGPSYELMRGIKDMQIEVQVPEITEVDEKNTEKKPEKKATITKEWVEKDVVKKYHSLIPQKVTLKGSYILEDSRSSVVYNFTWVFDVPGWQLLRIEKSKS